MKKIILLVILTLGALQADDVVKYDTKEVNNPISKPNHPSTEIYQ